MILQNNFNMIKSKRKNEKWSVAENILLPSRKNLSNPVLTVKNLTKAFGKRLVINNASFDVYEGEIFGLLGPTDSGKSAILRAITGSIIPSNGEISILGYNYKQDFAKAASYMSGFITLPNLYGYLTGLENIKLFTSLRDKFDTTTIENAARLVDIEPILKTKLAKYTLVEKKKLCIAMSLISNPKLIVLDDPFTGLNASELKDIQDLIKNLANKHHIAFLLSSQMLGQLEAVCNTIGIVNNGTILETRSMDSLRQISQKEQKLAYTVDYPNFAGKIVLNEFNFPTQVCGNKILIHCSENNKAKITQRLENYKISIFKVEVISKSLEQLLEEVLYKKAFNKSFVEEYK